MEMHIYAGKMPGKMPGSIAEKCPEAFRKNAHLIDEVDFDFIGAGGSTIEFQDKGRLPQWILRTTIHGENILRNESWGILFHKNRKPWNCYHELKL